ncbi:hypothetical protein RJT34_03171 [Clitoria ternatea]|uniref:Uncharacterized protein n=1 Tax=Clitoria ternatea TaxID=43366 RepID=A0AAN9Q2A3_CLITE
MLNKGRYRERERVMNNIRCLRFGSMVKGREWSDGWVRTCGEGGGVEIIAYDEEEENVGVGTTEGSIGRVDYISQSNRGQGQAPAKCKWGKPTLPSTLLVFSM